ncbi:MAG TPA: ATP-binding protein [Blastocatellia bacterium]|nr:ATP-binding protein [Blastocatellia bacterium]
MKISTRLITLLTISVNAVMLVTTFLILRQTEANLMAAAKDEIRAHATTLRIALEENYASGRSLDAEQLINRLSENTNIHAAILFNAEGQIEVVSNRLLAGEITYPGEVQLAIEKQQPIEFIRRINNQDVLSVIAPLLNGKTVVGAIEIAQSISFIQQELAQERRTIALTATILSLIILAISSMVLHFNLTRPVQAMLNGAIAIGKGDLSYRVIVPRTSGEFVRLAREFNYMAAQLAQEREALARETEEKLALARKLRHSERLAAVGRLAAGVAHEVGAPLQVIDGRAKQLIERHDAELETRQRNLTIIRAQTERITRIVRQMLNLSRPYNLQRQPICLHDLIAEVTEAIEISAAHHKVQIETYCAGNHIIAVDSGLLLQALLNICQNAIQAMPEGGRLKIECLAEATQHNGSPMTVIRISDTGPGISPEHLEHIFDPFYTTKDVGHGTGLGLAVSSRIVEEHGGGIEVSNHPAGGSIFSVFLPQNISQEA